MLKVKLSIIIVHYKVKDVLFDCLKSIYKADTKIPFEIIVVDNDEKKTIGEELGKFFPNVKYIKTLENCGFGGGNNIGVEHAIGNLLFFLSPDTKIFPGTIEKLVEIFQKNKKAAIAAPLIIDKDGEPYPLQGSGELTPIRGIIALSILNKFFPNNPISSKYWLKTWDKKSIIDVDVAPGTAFVIRKDVFEKVGGFDKRFFLYFEESDLCKRVKKIGYKVFINPHSRIFHIWGASTKDLKTSDIFSRSRFLYFRKHFGFIAAVAVHIATNINKVNIFLVFILCVASFLRFYRLSDLMMFIGDQGWFYLSARDMILTGNIPLVGPETSHPWIHHGPLWTYVLAIILWVFNFNPVAPAYFIAGLGVVTVWLLYKVSSEMFTKRVGLIASFLYATSPLIVLNARIPYHTSPIPFFAILLFYSVYKWMKGNVYFFPPITFLIAVLYNHELTTFVFSIPLFLLITYGFWKKKKWAIGLLNKKMIFSSVVLFMIPMVPFVLYDIGHGYKQTIGFLVWVLYRLVSFPLSIFGFDKGTFYPVHSFLELSSYLQQLIFASNLIISLLIFGLSVGLFFYLFIRELRNRSLDLGIVLLFLYLFIPLFALFLHRVPIEADILLISPFIIIAMAVFVDRLMNFSLLKKFLILILLFISFVNVRFILSTNYLTINTAKDRLTISKQLRAADSIIQIAKGKNYNLEGKGELSFFPVFTMPYEYFLWWKGYPPTKEKVGLKIVVWERDGEIKVYKEK